MCGIVGILQTDGCDLTEADRRLLSKQLSMLAYRGPDGSGEFVQGDVAFGHRRLAIRDLEQGRQPWLSSNGDCVLTYNGEIYNDVELRRELADEFPFHSQCDTEVVMAAYLKWGRACVDRLRGMFAFAIYDFRDSSLWLVRDRFGIKPLYYATLGKQFIFASHPAAILMHPQYAKLPDWSVVSHYLSTTRLTLGSRSMYRGIHLLQPAEEMLVRDGGMEVRRYWDYPTTVSSMSYADAVDCVEDELTNAVRSRLVSDVPVGLFLSGGVDSCTIASILHEIDARPRHAFCASVRGRNERHDVDFGADELRYAQECADLYSNPLQTVSINGFEYLNRWQELLQAFRLPMSTPSDVMIYELARAAKAHVGVVLGGEGSDELLCGYEVVSWSGHDYDAMNSGSINNERMRESVMRQYGRSRFLHEADHYFALSSLIPTIAKSHMLNAAVLDSTEHDNVMFGHYQTIFDSYAGLSTTEKYAMVLHRINLESLLSRLDSTTMLAGLEARVPFTDHHFVEQVLQLPLQYRMDVRHDANSQFLASAELSATGRIRSKRVLRDVARRRLPPQLANRRKASFPTGVQRWLKHEWAQVMSRYLAQSPFARFVFTESFINELVQSPAQAGMWLWPIVNLSFWGDAEFFGRPYMPQGQSRTDKTLVA